MNMNMAHESHSIAKEQHHIKLVVGNLVQQTAMNKHFHKVKYTPEVNMNNILGQLPTDIRYL